MFDKLKELGPRICIVPVAFCTVVAIVFGIALMPMLQANPHDIRFAVVNQDKGATLSIGSSNIGDTLVENLLNGEGLGDTSSTSSMSGTSNSSSSSDSPESTGEQAASGTISTDALVWEQMDSQQAVLDAMNAGENLYGALIIPENFTAQQMNSLVGIGDAPELKVLLNYGRNPQTVGNLQSTMQNMMLRNGITVDVEMVNQKDLGGGLMTSAMCVQFMVMPLLIMCLVPTLLFYFAIWPQRTCGAPITRKEKAQAAGKQIAFGLFSSLIAALVAYLLVSLFGGMNGPAIPIICLLWIGGFGITICIQGFNDIALPLGIFAFLTIFCLGMGTAMFGPEMLPSFWADFVYPWAPQAGLGDGLRKILFMGYNLGMLDYGRYLGMIALGFAAMLVGVVKPEPKANAKS